MNDRGIEQVVLLKLQHSADTIGSYAAIGLFYSLRSATHYDGRACGAVKNVVEVRAQAQLR